MADPNNHEFLPNRHGRCKQVLGYRHCGLPEDAPPHQRAAAHTDEPPMCSFHPTTPAVLVDVTSNEPVCQMCLDYRTCPHCRTIAPFGAWQCECGAFQCASCGKLWTPRNPEEVLECR